MPTRDNLIADWRKRLAEASEAATDSTSRPAWITRLRIRLYRFLLSLYESGDWNAPEAIEEKSAEPSPTSTITDESPLSGKPAKSTDVIRHALTSISGAQDRLIKPGALAGELLDSGWVVVGSSSAHVRTDRLASLLRRAGIASRISQRGDDRLVEVPARNRDEAFALIAENQSALRGRDQRGQFEGINFLVGLVTIIVLYAPLGALFMLWPLVQALDQSDLTGPTARSILGLYFLGWAACIIVYCSIAIWPKLKRGFIKN